MKKKFIGIIGIVIIVVVILLVIFLGDKRLDLESDQVQTLYTYLGEVDVNRCGGLNAYTGEEVMYDTISNENKLCMAYYALSDDEKSSESTEVTTTNENDINLCEIGEGIRLASDEDDNTCNYTVISENDLNNAYQKIYDQESPDEESFYISSTEACFLEEGEYYCGNSETSKVTIVPEATVYRLLNSASKKMNGDIVITDYYLRVSNNKCYANNSSNDEISACSTALEGDTEVTREFVQEYGTLYEHTFKQDDNGAHYWYSSNLK